MLSAGWQEPAEEGDVGPTDTHPAERVRISSVFASPPIWAGWTLLAATGDEDVGLGECWTNYGSRNVDR